jgi:hypothetical protein
VYRHHWCRRGRQIGDGFFRLTLESAHYRYRHLSARIGAHKALTAIARELAGFVWAVGHVLEEIPAAA